MFSNVTIPMPKHRHEMSDEEFTSWAQKNNDHCMNLGLSRGWWEKFNDKGPICVKRFKISDFKWEAELLVHLGIFESITQARKNGIKKPIVTGVHFFKFKRKGQFEVHIE